MTKKIKNFIIVILVVLLIIISISIYLLLMQKKSYNITLPVTTQKDFDAVEKLPKEKCSCWDSRNNKCLPQTECF